MINAFIELFPPFGFIFLIVSGKSTAGASSGQDSSSAFACHNYVPAVVAKAKNLV